MNKTAALFIIAMLTLAAACGAAQPPEDWNKLAVAYRDTDGEYRGAWIDAKARKYLLFDDFIRHLSKDGKISWSTGEHGNWTAEKVVFNEKLNKDQAMRWRFFKMTAPSNKKIDIVVLAEMNLDGRSLDMFIKRMIDTTAKKVSADMAK